MQPDRPYQMIEVLGSCQVGTVWSAVDVQGRALTVAILSATAGADQRWREAFAAAANALGQPQSGGPHFLYADFTAATPWVACAVDGGSGAERVFLALGQEYQPVPPDFGDSAGPVTTVRSGATAGVGPPTAGPLTAATPPLDDAEVTQRVPAVGSRPAAGMNPWSAGPPVSPAAPAAPVSAPPAAPVAPVSSPPVSPAPQAGPPQASPPAAGRAPASRASGSAPAIPRPVPSAAPAPDGNVPASHGPDSRRPVGAEPSPDLPGLSPADEAAAWRPRILPSPPAPRRPPLIALVVGLVVGILAAGAGGYLIGVNTAEPGTPTTPASGRPSDGSLAPYEAAQQELNRAKFAGDLAPLAEPWLARIGGCATNNDPGGPQLPADEQGHVFCRYGGLSVHFAQFRSPAERDAARAYRQRLYLEASELAPGLEAPARKPGGATKAAGSYVEYAFRGSDERAICGLWWDRDDGGSAALYLETLCEEGLGGRWEPLRDLWQRHS